jgi:uncharacterized protein (DUF488 family)
MRIWTIGHSTRAIDEFIALLTENEIKLVIDVRAFPGSKRYPQFNKEALAKSLSAYGIRYEHFPELGGKRKSKPDSRNTAWRNASFRGYADYMETEQFQKGIERLLEIAAEGPTAIVCAEAVWWRCHRSLIADYLKARGGEVLHILSANKVEPHPYTSAARIVNGELSYAADSLLERRSMIAECLSRALIERRYGFFQLRCAMYAGTAGVFDSRSIMRSASH